MTAAAADASVRVERDGAVATLVLNEPKSMNAMSAGIKAGIEDSLPGLLADPEVRAIVITGTGKAFCAGGDIRSMDDRGTLSVKTRMTRTYRWLIPLLTADKPIICAVNGAAAGAGLSLALTGDIILASRDARFKAGFPGLGAAADLGLAYTLPRAIGYQRASDILLTNREVSAEEAHAMGLVARLTEPEALMVTAMETARALAAGPTISLALTKRLLRRSYELPIEGFLEFEAMSQVVAFGSADFAEGVAAFKGKRKPDFRGR
ncbi:enoyl-CoA hydratase/isomerase family protein [Phreatobacter sp. HK31-P]